jgi:hypothetical protein
MDSDTLLLYLKLKLRTSQKKEIEFLDSEKFDEIIRTLDNLTFELIEKDKENIEPFEDLIKIFKSTAPNSKIHIFDDFIKYERLKKIESLRDASIQNKTLFQATECFSEIDIEPFSLELYNWGEIKTNFVSFLDNINTKNYDSLVDLCKLFFNNFDTLTQPDDFPAFSDHLIKSLLDKKIINKDLITPLSSDIRVLQRYFKRTKSDLIDQLDNGNISTDKFNSYGETSKKVLNEILLSGKTKSIYNFILSWNGPGKAQILSDFWEYGDKSDEISELIFAFTGINPETHHGRWLAWIREKNIHNNQLCNQFKDLVFKHNELYQISLIISFNDLLEYPDIWKTALNDTVSHFAAELSDNVLLSPQKVIVKKPPPIPLTKVPPPLPVDSDDENLLDEIEEVLSTAHSFEISDEISIDSKPQCSKDKFVTENSTWSLYLKPFLNENWLGIIGASSLMAAWLFLSIWLWDKGQYHRLIAGALPMILTSLGLGWTSSFFYKLRKDGSTSNAVLLFSILSMLSIPFNILISLSMLKTGSFTLGFSLILVYLISIILLSRWLSKSFGFNPAAYLISINSLLIIPLGLKSYIIDSFYIEPVMFAGFFITCFFIHRFKNIKELSFKTLYLLFFGNFFLCIGILFLYFRVLPNQGASALLIQIAALTMLVLNKGKESKHIINSSCLSILGIFISFNTPFFTASFLLGTIFWAILQKQIKTNWITEIVSVYILLLPAVVIYSYFFSELRTLITFIPLILVLTLLAISIYEEKYADKESLFITYLFPVLFTLSSFVLKSENSLVFLSISILSFILFGLYGYVRYTRWYRGNLWFLNIFLTIYLPMLYLVLNSELIYDNYSLAILPSSVLTLLFAISSKKINNTFNERYDTSILWLLSGINALLISLFVLSSYYTPGSIILLTAVINIFSLYLASVRSSSVLPVYIIFGQLGLIIFLIKNYLNIETRSGLGMAIAAFVLFLFSNIFVKYRSKKVVKKDLFFNHDFPFKNDHIFASPMKIISILLVACSILKAYYNFVPLYQYQLFSMDGLKIFIVLILNFLLTGYIVERYRVKFSGILILIPLTGLFISFLSLFPEYLLPHIIIASLFVSILLFRKISQSLSESITAPLNFFIKILNFTIIPISFGGYMIMFNGNANILLITLFTSMIIIFLQFFMFKSFKRLISHINTIHLLTLWYMVLLLSKLNKAQIVSLALNFNPDPFNNINVLINTFLFFAGPFILTIPVFFMEKSPGKVLYRYSNSAHFWFSLFSFLYTITLVFSFFTPFIYPSFFYGIGILIIYAGSRRYDFFFTEILKALNCCLLGYVLTTNLVTGIFAGLLIYTLLNITLYFSTKHSIRILSMVKPNRYIIKNAFVIHILIMVFVTSHLVYFTMGYDLKGVHYLLYLTIPWFVFLSKTFKYSYISYVGAGIIAYANFYISLNYIDNFKAMDLNIIHLLSLVSVLSILLYYIFIKTIEGPIENFMAKHR